MLPYSDGLLLILRFLQLSDVGKLQELELRSNLLSGCFGQFVKVSFCHNNHILKVVNEILSLAEHPRHDQQGITHQLVVAILRELHQGQEDIIDVIEPVKQVSFHLHVFHILLLVGSQLFHSVEPQILVLKITLQSLFSNVKVFPDDHLQQIIIVLLCARPLFSELQLHLLRVFSKVDLLEVNPLIEMSKNAHPRVGFHIHHYVDDVQALYLTKNEFLRYFTKQPLLVVIN